MTHYIFVVGGVISGLGKGVISASLATLLNHKRVTIKKIDPYFNISAGNLNPIEHGEVFVTADGCETDLDLGHYERIGGIKTSSMNTTSSGNLMKQFLDNQKITGETIQLIPHFSNHIMDFFRHESENYDYIIIEIGGSVSDIESQIYFESIRQFRKRETTTVIFITYVLKHNHEYKTKPTQNAVRKLRELGIQPDVIMCRVEDNVTRLPESIVRKIELFTDTDNIITIPTMSTIYHVPSILVEGLKSVLDIRTVIDDWKGLEMKIDSVITKSIFTRPVRRVGIVGKYHASTDSYYSIKEALKHAGWSMELDIHFIPIFELNEQIISNCDGIVVPGGFGERNVDIIIDIIKFCREHEKPMLGICFGLQLMYLEHCRNVLGVENANSEEFTGNKNDIVNSVNQDNSLRVGEVSISNKVKRVRHRYKVNVIPDDKFIKNIITDKYGIVYELKWDYSHFYEAVQHHPEYTSSPFHPEQKFLEFTSQL